MKQVLGMQSSQIEQSYEKPAKDHKWQEKKIVELENFG